MASVGLPMRAPVRISISWRTRVWTCRSLLAMAISAASCGPAGYRCVSRSGLRCPAAGHGSTDPNQEGKCRAGGAAPGSSDCALVERLSPRRRSAAAGTGNLTIGVPNPRLCGGAATEPAASGPGSAAPEHLPGHRAGKVRSPGCISNLVGGYLAPPGRPIRCPKKPLESSWPPPV